MFDPPTYTNNLTTTSLSVPPPYSMNQPVPFQQHPQPQLILEALNLTSFSTSPEIQSLTPSNQLPLKAIFKNTLVGFKYINISTSSNKKNEEKEVAFKRFQARFRNAEETLRFVRAIESVCPVSPVAEEKEKSNEAGSQIRNVAGGGGGGSLRVVGPGFSSPASATFGPPTSPSIRPPPPQPPTPSRHATLFPNLTASLHPSTATPGSESTTAAPITSRLLVDLGEKEFGKLLGQVLEEEGFEALVNRVQMAVSQKGFL